jgi:hypothetical protein
MAGYGSDGEFATWLAARGYVLPVTAPTAAVLRQIGSDYVDSAYEPRLGCSRRAVITQARAWPRVGHSVNGEALAADLIPQPWIEASYRAAWREASKPGWTASGVDPSRATKREKADVVEREFFAPGVSGAAGSANAAPGFPVDPQIDGAVAVWLCRSDRYIGIMVV